MISNFSNSTLPYSPDNPHDVILVGLGFMGFGFLASVKCHPWLRVPLLLTRRPSEAKAFLENKGFICRTESHPGLIKDYAAQGGICISDDLSLLTRFYNQIVVETTGTIAYGTDIALMTLKAKKHLITTNPELQVTVGTQLKHIANANGVVITDALGDQPGNLARMITHSRDMGFKILIAGNMKRFLNRYATQAEMQPWADDKGLAVRQTVSFTDGTKQAIEMELIANYFGLNLNQPGMIGPQVESVQEAQQKFPWDKIPQSGAVDYVIGKTLFPGIFLIAEHLDPHQQKYLRYLGLGDGPRYLLFEPYHLCHLEIAGTITKVIRDKQAIINNGSGLMAKTIAFAKTDLPTGQKLDGIGGDTIYGNIDRADSVTEYLPVGLTEGTILKNSVFQDQPIKLSDVALPDNAATRLLGLLKPEEEKHDNYHFHTTRSQRFIRRCHTPKFESAQRNVGG